MTKLLIVSNLYPPSVIGGAEIVAHRQAIAMRQRGYDVVVFAGGLPGLDFPIGALHLTEVDGLPTYRLALRSMSANENFQWDVARQRFKSVLSAHRPDIVHFHNLMGLGSDLIPVAKAVGARTVVTLHDHWGVCFKNTLLRNDRTICDDIDMCAVCRPGITIADGLRVPIRLRRDFTAYCLAQADLLISPSRYLAATYAASGLFDRPVHTISNGMDLANVPVIPKSYAGTFRFASFGYLGEHKGLSVLLDAADMLAADPSLEGRWTLSIAGAGEFKQTLEAMIESDRFRGAVSFVGKLPHAEALAVMGDAHAMILASIWPENEPVTLVEAIASGTAQIASRIGGNIELVDHDRSGYLFTPGDAAALASCMRELILDPLKSIAFGLYNAARRSDYCESGSIDAVEDLYRSQLSERKNRELIVLCAGSPPPGRMIDLVVHHFQSIEDKDRRIRFVRHEWADAEIWNSASLLWFWGTGSEEDLPVLARALRTSLPLLAPTGSVVRATVDGVAPIAAYDTFAEAAGHIAALQDAAGDLAELATTGPALARLLVGVAPRETFRLTSEAKS